MDATGDHLSRTRPGILTGQTREMSTQPRESSTRTTPWPLQHAEGLCLATEAGQLDDDLSSVIAAINRRTAAARTTSALSRLSIGTRVRLDQRVKPHLRGELATVHEFDDDVVVVVLLDRVVGRFSSRHVRCAPEVLELAEET